MRDDIHNAADLARIIRDEIPDNILKTPEGPNEDEVSTVTPRGATTPNPLSMYHIVRATVEAAAKQQNKTPDYKLKTRTNRITRLLSASEKAERAARYR